MTQDKRIAVDIGAADRILNLPKNVVDNIIGRLPVRDAARTTILSSEWRYIWAEYPELVLDKQFYLEIVKNKKQKLFPCKYKTTVHSILLQHLGPILKFVLDIPKIHPAEYSDIDQCLRFVSRKDVKRLTLHNRSPNSYKVPSYAFTSPKLAYLNVTRCVFSSPKCLDGCRKLTHLFLKSVTFQSSVVHFPKLVRLSLKQCSGTHLLSIRAPSLLALTHLINDDLDLSYYITCKDLVSVYIELQNGVEHHELDKQITLTKLLSCWPKLKTLYLGGFFLKHLAACKIPHRLPDDLLNSLVYLILFRITYNWDEISCILCLLRSSLKLSKLEIWMGKQIEHDERTTQYLKKPDLLERSLGGLKILTIINFKGSTSELLLVKLLLAYSPSLERICIQENQDLDVNERLKASKELMKFPRASPKAVIILLPEFKT